MRGRQRRGPGRLFQISLIVALSTACHPEVAAPAPAPLRPAAFPAADASQPSTLATAVASTDVDPPPEDAGALGRSDAGACGHIDHTQYRARKDSFSSEDRRGANACSVTDKNLARAERETASALAKASEEGPPPRAPWDRQTEPARLALIESRFGLTAAQHEAIARDGFVVVNTPTFDNYAEAFHEIYRSELPLWISVDSVLHAVFRSNDLVLADLEWAFLIDRLNGALEAMHCALAAEAAHYPPETARDVDLYLTVARSLLAGAPVPSTLGVDREARHLVARAMAAKGFEPTMLFGRRRMVDFSLYQPRGHYAEDASGRGHATLATYFRAATWLSHLELNLSTYDCASSSDGDRSQTPREVRAALALAFLMARAGVADDVANLDKAWRMLAGKREDVSFTALLDLAKEANVQDVGAPDADVRLRAVIGRRFPRTVRTEYTGMGCSDLPAISTMLGTRIVPDAQLARPLTSPRVADRQRIGAMDIAYALGEDRAKTYLADDLAKYPALDGALAEARAIARAPLSGEDLYSAWFGAIRDLSLTPSGTLPSVMQTDAFADLRLSSTVAAFGQLRHNFVLFAAEDNASGSCAIPDAFVEPAPAVYDGLIDYAAKGEKAVALIAGDSEEGREVLAWWHLNGYFERLGNLLRLLRSIGQRELDNRPLPEPALRFLSMVVDAAAAFGGCGPNSHGKTFTGWYFDLFRVGSESLDTATFLADYHTAPGLGEAAYAGVRGVKLGIFVVDTAGGPRAVVGPVSDAFEAHEPLPRLDDSKVPRAHAKAPWTASYTRPGPPAPPLKIDHDAVRGENSRVLQVIYRVSSTGHLGPVTIDLLDRHRHPVRSLTHDVDTAPVDFVFPPDVAAEFAYNSYSFRVRVGQWQAWHTGVITDSGPSTPYKAGGGWAWGG